MSKRKTPIVFRRDIILGLNGYEALDLMHELRGHERDLKDLIKQINEDEEAVFYEDTGLEDAQRSLNFTRELKSRLLRIYRRWQEKSDAVVTDEKSNVPVITRPLPPHSQ